MWHTVDQSTTTFRKTASSSLSSSPFPLPSFAILRVSGSLFNFPSRRSRVIEKQARKLYQLCGNYFPRYCHRSCALLNNSLLYVHSVNVYEILLRELGLPFANRFSFPPQRALLFTRSSAVQSSYSRVKQISRLLRRCVEKGKKRRKGKKKEEKLRLYCVPLDWTG